MRGFKFQLYILLFLCLLGCENKTSEPSAYESVYETSQREQAAIKKKPVKLNETQYQSYWALQNGGLKTEFECPDGTKCDIVSDVYAVEVDWAHKWYESFGQSLWYSYQLNKKPAVLLILREEEDQKYVTRIKTLAQHHGITLGVYQIGPGLSNHTPYLGDQDTGIGEENEY